VDDMASMISEGGVGEDWLLGCWWVGCWCWCDGVLGGDGRYWKGCDVASVVCVYLYILACVGCEGIGGRGVGEMVSWAVMDSFTRRVMLRLWCVSVSFYVCKYLLSVRWVGCW